MHTSPNPRSAAARDNPFRHFFFAFLIALVLYITAYSWIQNRRTRKGPWQIAFTNYSGTPAIVVNQPWLKLTNVSLVFINEQLPQPTNQPAFNFRDPRPTPFDAGFSRCVFEDLTFLPGTVTIQAYGHEIELLPRVLIIDHTENQWRSEGTINLTRKGK